MTRVFSMISVVSLGLALSGCHIALVGNALVLLITVGIFAGTLSLGRVRQSAGASASRSESAAPKR